MEQSREVWLELLRDGIGVLEEWEGAWPETGALWPGLPEPTARDAIDRLARRLADNFPYFHPLYAGHMLQPPHPVSWIAYALTSLVNPNNNTREVSEATTEMELEVVAEIGAMLGFDAGAIGHLTTSGTMANLEAIWVAREFHTGDAIACSKAAHYNYVRIAGLLDVRLVEVPNNADDTLCTEALARVLREEDIGTVVVTLGTTGLGAIDPLHDVIELTREHGCRVHVDAAYGGFFALIADGRRGADSVDNAPFDAVRWADSVTIDPHKHGLQPYGLGCIIHRDAEVVRLFRHDSPYTYADPSRVHMGQIQIECSRSGAAAAALWATLAAIPLEREVGLGPMLSASRRAAVEWSAAIASSSTLRVVVGPQLDIVSFAVCPTDRDGVRSSDVSRWTAELIARGQTDRAFYLTRYEVPADQMKQLWPELVIDTATVTVIRACMMKPSHKAWWPRLHERVAAAAAAILDRSERGRAELSADLRCERHERVVVDDPKTV